jgi:hypothetical protein
MTKQLQPNIAGLKPYFIPPHRFASKQWFSVDDGRVRWFYHRPRAAGTHVVSSTPLLPTVDAGLRPLVHEAHRRGVVTGPSCEGHEATRFPQKLLAGLKHHESHVRGKGLMVTDVETGQSYLWREPTYRFSAPLFRQSQDNEVVFRLVGILPLKGSAAALHPFVKAAEFVPGAWVDCSPGWVNIWVGTESPLAQRQAWHMIWQRVRHGT